MRTNKFFHALVLVTFALGIVTQALQTQPPQSQQPPPTQQPAAVSVVLTGVGGPPRLAVPEFIPLSKEPDVLSAAKTIADVLWEDFAFEKEFYLIARDTLRTVPRPASPDEWSIERWKEVGADGVVIGSVRRTADGIVVEARLMNVANGVMSLGKQYTGSLRSLSDGGRIFAHSIADEIHKQQRNLRGVARTKLAFSSDREGARMKGPTAERDISNIYRADYDGANQSRMTVTRSLDIAPVWAPDGNMIAYTSYRSGYPDIIVQMVNGLGEPSRPARGTAEAHNFLAVWSPDGTKLAFSSNRDGGGNSEIYIVNRDGTGLRRITNHPMADTTPTWSPTGAQLAFTSDRSGSPQVYVVNVDGTDLRRISEESYCDRATWSPAPFNEIAYTSRTGGGYEIRVFDFATRTSRPITDGIGSNEQPAFAPNGRHLAFTSDRTGQAQIYTIARDGTGLRQITRLGSNRYPNWSQ